MYISNTFSFPSYVLFSFDEYNDVVSWNLPCHNIMKFVAQTLRAITWRTRTYIVAHKYKMNTVYYFIHFMIEKFG